MATRPKSINRREVARNNCNHLGNVMVKTQQFLSGTKEIIKNALFTVRLGGENCKANHEPHMFSSYFR